MLFHLYVLYQECLYASMQYILYEHLDLLHSHILWIYNTLTHYKIYLSRCWIGKRKLDAACEQVKDIFNFKIHWKPFQLSPNTPEKGIPLLEYMRNKYGDKSAQDIINNVSPVCKAGKSLVRIQDLSICVSLLFQALCVTLKA